MSSLILSTETSSGAALVASMDSLAPTGRSLMLGLRLAVLIRLPLFGLFFLFDRVLLPGGVPPMVTIFLRNLLCNGEVAERACGVLSLALDRCTDGDFVLPCVLNALFGGDRMLLTTQDESNGLDKNQCYLFHPSSNKLQQNAQVQTDVQAIFTHLDDGTNIPVVKLQSFYSSLLYGLLDESDDALKVQVDQMAQSAVATIDTNGDGLIDLLEMDSIVVPPETGEFIFDDLVACTSPTTPDVAALETACVSAENVIDFLNQFYGGTTLVSPELAQHIRDESGPDACFTRTEFEASFSSNTNNSPATEAALSGAGLSRQQPYSSMMMEGSFVWSMALGVGTALYVFGMSLPF